MHTGYDSFSPKNGLEPVLNLTKNVLTDSYKQVQNGRHPNLLNSGIPPQSNIDRSNAINQQRTPNSQYPWPSSIYSVPIKPSSPYNQSGYLPHYTQQNFSDDSDLRNFKNPNIAVSKVQNQNSQFQNSNSNAEHFRSIQNGSVQTPRIRVLDVYSLNKSTISSELLNNGSYQKEQYGYCNYNSVYTNNQSQFANYGRGNLPQANHLPPYPNHQMASHLGPPQQFHQNSTAFPQQNSGSQHQFVTNRTMDMNVNFEAFKTGPQNVPALQELHSSRNNQDLCFQKNRSISSNPQLLNALRRPVINRHSTQINNNSVSHNPGYRDVSNRVTSDGPNLGSISQIQNQQGDSSCSLRKNSSICSNISTPASISDKAGYLQGREQETVIKISIPHSGQNTFITLGDCGSTNKNSNLPCPLDENNKFFSEQDQNSFSHKNKKMESNVMSGPTGFSRPQTTSSVGLVTPNPSNSGTDCRNNLTVPPRKRFCQVKEPLVDVNRENLNEFLNSPPVVSERSTDNSVSRVRKSESLVRETTFQEKITANTLELKQENVSVRVEKPAECESNTTENGKSLFEIIKKEKNPTDENAAVEEGPPEELNDVEESLTMETEFTEFSSPDVKEFDFLPDTPETVASKNSETCIEQMENLNSSNNKKKDSSTENNPEELKKCLPLDLNYKSRIDRTKLDMLIQFLEMDEELNEEGKNNKTDGCTLKKEADLNHNRRKISKTCVIKNRNNSREMIAMKSNKTGRVEPPKCSPPAPLVEKSITDKFQEGKNTVEEKSKADGSGGALEPDVNSNSPEVIQIEGEDSSDRSEPISLIGSVETVCIENPEEHSPKPNCAIPNVENLINIIRALETTHCGTCDLVCDKPNLLWINFASGALKCSNCFKKERESQSNTLSNVEKTVRKEHAEKRSENSQMGNALEKRSDNSLHDSNKVKGSSKFEQTDKSFRMVKEVIKLEVIDSIDLAMLTRKETTVEEIMKESNLKEDKQIRYSEVKSKGEMKNGKTKRRDSAEEENGIAPKTSKEGIASTKATSPVENLKKYPPTDQSTKKNSSKEQQDSSKKQENVRKRSVSKEKEVTEENSKKEKKSGEDPNQIRKRRDSKGVVSCKSPEEHSKKESKTVMDSADKAAKKTIECYPSVKDINAEQTTKKRTKLQHANNGKIQSPSRENNIGHKPKESDSEELKRKNANNSEKHKNIELLGHSRKRKNSVEDPVPTKVRIVEDQRKKNIKPVQLKASIPKEETEKQKTRITDESQIIRNSTLNRKRNSVSSEEGEHVRNSSKEKESLKEDPMYQKIKAYEQAKQKATETTELTRRKSKEEQVLYKNTKHEIKQSVEVSERRKSKDDVGEPHKQGSLTTENQKNRSRKSDTTSRLLKERQNTKVKNEKNKDRGERKKSSEKRNVAKGEKETEEKSARTKAEDSSYMKMWTDRSGGKSKKIQTENRQISEKAIEQHTGHKTEDGALTKPREDKNSDTLLSKLLEKTNELSWSLLSEA